MKINNPFDVPYGNNTPFYESITKPQYKKLPVTQNDENYYNQYVDGNSLPEMPTPPSRKKKDSSIANIIIKIFAITAVIIALFWIIYFISEDKFKTEINEGDIIVEPSDVHTNITLEGSNDVYEIHLHVNQTTNIELSEEFSAALTEFLEDFIEENE